MIANPRARLALGVLAVALVAIALAHQSGADARARAQGCEPLGQLHAGWTAASLNACPDGYGPTPPRRPAAPTVTQWATACALFGGPGDRQVNPPYWAPVQNGHEAAAVYVLTCARGRLVAWGPRAIPTPNPAAICQQHGGPMRVGLTFTYEAPVNQYRVFCADGTAPEAR